MAKKAEKTQKNMQKTQMIAMFFFCSETTNKSSHSVAYEVASL